MARSRSLLAAVRDRGGRAFVADTAPIVYRVERRAAPRLTAACDELFEAVEAGAVDCIVGAVTVAELLVVPLQVGPQAVGAVDTFLRQPSVVIAPVAEEVARAAARLVAARVVQRLSDALIAATALELGLPLVTGDRRLARAEGVNALLVADYTA